MPKPLREPVPSSSVARLLDAGAAARAIAPVEHVIALPGGRETEPAEPAAGRMPARPHAGVPRTTGEAANVKREFVLTPSSEEAFRELVECFREATGTKLTSSHVARALFTGVRHAMDSIKREARRMEPVKLPSNARGREGDRDEFEQRIASSLIAGIRAAPALEFPDT